MTSVIRGENFLKYSPCTQVSSKNESEALDDKMIGDIDVLLPITTTECSVATAQYNINISYTNGIQSVDYSTAETQALPPFDEKSPSYGTPQDSNPLQSMEEYINMLALTDALLSIFNYEGMHLKEIPFGPHFEWNPPTQEEIRFPNGSSAVTEACDFWIPECVFNASKLDLSLLQAPGPNLLYTRRFS